MRLIFILFMLLTMLSCATTRVTDPSISSTAQSDSSQYSVKQGDTIASIAKQFSVSPESIIRANKLPSSFRVNPGTQITIPEPLPLLSTSLKFIWPMKGEVLNSFGQHANHVINRGLNIRARSSQQVIASETGKVVFANTLKGWGTIVVLKHINNFYTVYANLKETNSREGAFLKKGDYIGAASASSELQGYVLHFEIRKQHSALNPMDYLAYN